VYCAGPVAIATLRDCAVFRREVDEIVLCWGVTQRRVEIPYDVSGQRISPIFKGQEIEEEITAHSGNSLPTYRDKLSVLDP